MDSFDTYVDTGYLQIMVSSVEQIINSMLPSGDPRPVFASKVLPTYT